MSSRHHILDVAWRLISEGGSGAVSMSAVARAAGVSRQAVHLHFETRAGLLTAMARHQDERSGFIERMQAAAAHDDPRVAVEAMVRTWLGYVPEILAVGRALEAEGAEAWHDRMRDLRRGFRSVLRRMELADGWTLDAAADWLWSRTHPAAYHQLVVERGWSPEAFADRTIASVLRELGC